MTMVALRLAWAVPVVETAGPMERSPTPKVWVVNPVEDGLKALAEARRPVETKVVNFILGTISDFLNSGG